MTTRGTTLKTDTPQCQTLLRPMVTRRYELNVDHQQCCGCSICATVCPREAITLSPVTLEAGRVVVNPRVDINDATCIFCGECVVLLPDPRPFDDHQRATRDTCYQREGIPELDSQDGG